MKFLLRCFGCHIHSLRCPSLSREWIEFFSVALSIPLLGPMPVTFFPRILCYSYLFSRLIFLNADSIFLHCFAFILGHLLHNNYNLCDFSTPSLLKKEGNISIRFLMGISFRTGFQLRPFFHHLSPIFLSLHADEEYSLFSLRCLRCQFQSLRCPHCRRKRFFGSEMFSWESRGHLICQVYWKFIFSFLLFIGSIFAVMPYPSNYFRIIFVVVSTVKLWKTFNHGTWRWDILPSVWWKKLKQLRWWFSLSSTWDRFGYSSAERLCRSFFLFLFLVVLSAVTGCWWEV